EHDEHEEEERRPAEGPRQPVGARPLALRDCHGRHRRNVYQLGSRAAMALTPSRTVAELRELQQLTGDENGAQRVAWTETWEQAREWLRGKVDGLPVEEEIDEAGNQWFTLRGASERAGLSG